MADREARPLASARVTDASFVPTWVGELDLADEVRDLVPPPDEDGRPYRRARLLARVHGTPIGFAALELEDGRLDGERVRREVTDLLGGKVREHLAADGLPADGWDGGELPAAPDPRCTQPGPYPQRAIGLASVVVCTRDRAEILPQALRSILDSDHPQFEIVVVDNAPTTSDTRDVVDAIDDPRIRYVLEPRGGMSPARNAGFEAARGDFIVFTDDDVRVERSWLRDLLNGFTRAEHVGCATGLVVGAELATPAQWYFESRVNWSKLLETRIYDLDRHRDDDPMFPFRAGRYGTGANFAVTRETYRSLGGMDLALGAGTPTLNGEDLDFFLRVLLSGRALAVESRAVVWHWHRREVDALNRQMRAYGVGLSAYATKHLLNPRTMPAIARRIPAALAAVVGDTQAAEATEGTPEGLAGTELRGLLSGAPRYVLSRLRTPGAMPISGPRA